MNTTAKAEPEPSPAEKFRQFAKQVLSVPKAEIERREQQYQKERTNQHAKSRQTASRQS